MNKQTNRNESSQQPMPENFPAKKVQRSHAYWIKKNWYFHSWMKRFYRFSVPPHMRVLHIGCGTGATLHALQPLQGVGIDGNEHTRKAARAQYPELSFLSSVDMLSESFTFDYILISSVNHVHDVQDFFTQLKQHCTRSTRIIIDGYTYAWEPLLALTQKIGLRRPTDMKHWLSQADVRHMISLAGFQTVSEGNFLLMPFYVPLISWVVNTWIARLPLIRNLCLMRFLVARPVVPVLNPNNVTVSVVIPCRNEKGNVEAAVQRTPKMGAGTELIFVEGNSKDDTLGEIKRVAAAYPDTDIKYFVQDGKGKGDAVRKGFAHATGDVLMILDADLTMPPEELPKYFDALLRNQGECINGSRLVYGMESDAMRFLNVLANFFFSVVFSAILGQRVKDTLCGTKVLWKREYEQIVANRSFFGDFDPFGDFDLLFGAAKLHLKIIDMPIHYKNRVYGSTQIRRFYHGWILLWMSVVGLRKLIFW